MKMYEINPFVRFAFSFVLVTNKDLYTSADCRIFFIENGKGHIELDSVVYPFNSGTLIMWQAGTPYRFILDQNISVTAINFDYTFKRKDTTKWFSPMPYDMEKNNTIHQTQYITFEDCTCLNKPIIINNASTLTSKIKKLTIEHSSMQPYSRERESALLKLLITDIIKLSSLPSLTIESSKKLNIVLDYIHNNYNKKIDNTTLAKLVNYHPYYLNKLMKYAHGITIHQYVINYRINIAESMLVSTNDTVSAIASNVGFSDLVSFIINFKNKNSMTPTEFRETHKA